MDYNLALHSVLMVQIIRRRVTSALKIDLWSFWGADHRSEGTVACQWVSPKAIAVAIALPNSCLIRRLLIIKHTLIGSQGETDEVTPYQPLSCNQCRSITYLIARNTKKTLIALMQDLDWKMELNVAAMPLGHINRCS